MPVRDRLPRNGLYESPDQITSETAVAFVHGWLQDRWGQSGETVRRLLGELRVHTRSDPWGRSSTASGEPDSVPHFWIVGATTAAFRLHDPAETENWDRAFHASHMGALWSILCSPGLAAGYRAKQSNHNKQLMTGCVYFHKMGTRRKCASYAVYLQFPGFIAAVMYEALVAPPWRPDGRRSCGDQWAVPPQSVQVTALWFHVVPNASVIRNDMYWIADRWAPDMEMLPMQPRR